ncbi:MAG: AAA family ATPase [Candidatus Hydrogenedentota bacterium]
MIEIRARIIKKIFENKDNGFTVLCGEKCDDGESVVIVGYIFPVNTGEEYEFSGEWVTDKRYGLQFQCEFFKQIPPSDEEALIRFLKSALKGVGNKTATAIVAKFGKDTLNVIENTPDRLLEVHGIRKKTKERIIKSYKELYAIRDLMLFLSKYNIPTHWAFKIYNSIGVNALEFIERDPFVLMYYVKGIGFKKADDIYKRMGGKNEDDARIRAGMVYSLENALQEGDLFLYSNEWIEASSKILDIEKNKVLSYSKNKIAELYKNIVTEEDKIYLGWVYQLECNVSELLARISKCPLKNRPDFSFDRLKFDLELDSEQVQALNNAWKEKIFILTGGPGTGKTTILKYLVSYAKQAGLIVKLASPTGRAAKRLQEATGSYASTLHRLLEYDGETFGRDADNRLQGDIFIVDEASMIDLFLFYHFLLAFPYERASLILVGDPYQLPPVGAGNVLNEMIKSNKFNTVYLKNIYRQEQESMIIVNAHRILNGKEPTINNIEGKDFFFIEEETDKIEETIKELCTSRLPSYKDYNPMKDIQVLSPMYKGIAGVHRLNYLLQKAINNSKLSKEILNTPFRLGDKVMQTVNDYKKDVTNGEIGIIISAGYNYEELKNNCRYITDKKRVIDWYRELDYETREIVDREFSLLIDFDNKIVRYADYELEELILAYCCTVHKSQGSEYKAVVFPIITSHYIMLKRNLFYTAVTRAQEVCVLVGSREAIEIAVKDDSIPKKNSILYKRISDKF